MRAMKCRCAIGSLARDRRGKNVAVNRILLPMLTYGLEIWTWNREQQSRVRDVERSYLREACGMTRLEGEINESMYERCGMRTLANVVKCDVVA